MFGLHIRAGYMLFHASTHKISTSHCMIIMYMHPRTLEYTCMHLPVGYPNQVSADHINPMQWSSPWPSSLPLWSASKEVLLGAMVRHPPYMA